MIDPREAQLKYELDSDAEAQALRLRELIANSDKGDLELPRAHVLIGQMCKVVAENITRVAAEKTRGLGGKYKSWLRALPTDVASVIAIRECIRMCSGPETHIHIQDLTYNVGKLWELEVRIRQAEEVNPLYMQRVHEQVKENCTRDFGHLRRLYGVAVDRVFKGTLDLSLTKTEMMQIGKFGVDACFDAGLIEIVRGTNKNGTSIGYVLAPEVSEFLRGYTYNDVRNLISKEETRMLCPPDPWTNLGDGGYLSIRRKAAAPLMNVRKIRKSVRAAVAAEFTAEKMPQVFACGNYLQSISFDMHGPTRAAILRVWASGGNVMGVPPVKGPQKPEFPFPKEWVKEDASPEETEVFNRWKRKSAIHYTELREWRGKVREVGAFLRAVREVEGPSWFPVYFDSRGRWYYRGTPNPQGSDLAKSVLHFSQKRPLGARGLFWLKVHVANSAGFDKARPKDRAAWTEQNWPRIVLALDEPENYPDVWGKDAPWCMFSAAWELREAMRSGSPELYCTGIPIHMDATCSGLQHFSALLRDPIGGLYVNLFEGPDFCGPKQDIYGHVASIVVRMLNRDLLSADATTRTMANFFMQVGVSRELAKKPVMTYVYGATLRGTADHVELLMDKEILPACNMAWPADADTFQYSLYLARKLFAGIAAAVPAAAAAMRWLREVVKQQPDGRRMTWHTPTGFWVQHDYQDYDESRVRLNSCGIVHTMVRDWNEGTRTIPMQNAVSPNFVHALDASHLTLVANSMAADGLQMVGIHDSFGTHPCDVDSMHFKIREQFVALYSGPNLLSEFLWEVGGAGEAPARGSLSLPAVMDAEFMFC